jgi:hypothetical protein
VGSCSGAGLTLQKGGPIVAMMHRAAGNDIAGWRGHGKKDA